MSVFVVVWHMGGGGHSLIFSKDAYFKHVFTLSDFVNFHMLLLAVPMFIFISIYLYASKPINTTSLKKRLVRLLILFSFWPIALILYNNGFHGLLVVIPNSPVDLVYKVLRAGNTIYYFFPSLIACLLITHLFLQMKKALQILMFIVTIFILISLPQITKITGYFPLCAHWNPLNFVSISFAAALFAQNQGAILKYKNLVLLLSVILCVLFSMIEWNYSVGHIIFTGQGYAIPAYTRTSLLFAVIAVFVLALNPSIKGNSIIKHMSTYSLALYCIHPFLIPPIRKFTTGRFQNDTASLYLSIILVVVLGYFMAMLLRRYYLREETIV